MIYKKNIEPLIAACMITSSTAEIARKTGLSENTVRKYRADPDFMTELTKRRNSIIDTVYGKMISCLEESTDVLMKIIRDENSPPAVRVSAISTLYKQIGAYREQIDFDNRLSTLESEKQWNIF